MPSGLTPDGFQESLKKRSDFKVDRPLPASAGSGMGEVGWTAVEPLPDGFDGGELAVLLKAEANLRSWDDRAKAQLSRPSHQITYDMVVEASLLQPLRGEWGQVQLKWEDLERVPAVLNLLSRGGPDQERAERQELKAILKEVTQLPVFADLAIPRETEALLSALAGRPRGEAPQPLQLGPTNEFSAHALVRALPLAVTWLPETSRTPDVLLAAAQRSRDWMAPFANRVSGEQGGTQNRIYDEPESGEFHYFDEQLTADALSSAIPAHLWGDRDFMVRMLQARPDLVSIALYRCWQEPWRDDLSLAVMACEYRDEKADPEVLRSFSVQTQQRAVDLGLPFLPGDRSLRHSPKVMREFLERAPAAALSAARADLDHPKVGTLFAHAIYAALFASPENLLRLDPVVLQDPRLTPAVQEAVSRLIQKDRGAAFLSKPLMRFIQSESEAAKAAELAPSLYGSLPARFQSSPQVLSALREGLPEALSREEGALGLKDLPAPFRVEVDLDRPPPEAALKGNRFWVVLPSTGGRSQTRAVSYDADLLHEVLAMGGKHFQELATGMGNTAGTIPANLLPAWLKNQLESPAQARHGRALAKAAFRAEPVEVWRSLPAAWKSDPEVAAEYVRHHPEGLNELRGSPAEDQLYFRRCLVMANPGAVWNLENLDQWICDPVIAHAAARSDGEKFLERYGKQWPPDSTLLERHHRALGFSNPPGPEQLSKLFLELVKSSTRHWPLALRHVPQLHDHPSAIRELIQSGSPGVVHAEGVRLDRDLILEALILQPSLFLGSQAGVDACLRLPKGEEERVKLIQGTVDDLFANQSPLSWVREDPKQAANRAEVAFRWLATKANQSYGVVDRELVAELIRSNRLLFTYLRDVGLGYLEGDPEVAPLTPPGYHCRPPLPLPHAPSLSEILKRAEFDATAARLLPPARDSVSLSRKGDLVLANPLVWPELDPQTRRALGAQFPEAEAAYLELMAQAERLGLPRIRNFETNYPLLREGLENALFNLEDGRETAEWMLPGEDWNGAMDPSQAWKLVMRYRLEFRGAKDKAEFAEHHRQMEGKTIAVEVVGAHATSVRGAFSGKDPRYASAGNSEEGISIHDARFLKKIWASLDIRALVLIACSSGAGEYTLNLASTCDKALAGKAKVFAPTSPTNLEIELNPDLSFRRVVSNTAFDPLHHALALPPRETE